jgi:hypothetical protein
VPYYFHALFTGFKRVREAKTSIDNIGRHMLGRSRRLIEKAKAHLETKSRADLILRLNPAIRYVAIIDNSNTIVECRGQGAGSLALSPETFLDFASIGPLLVLASMACKLESSCGRLEYATGRFQNALVTIYQLRSHMIVTVTDPTVQTQEIEEIGASLKKTEEGTMPQPCMLDLDVIRYGA